MTRDSDHHLVIQERQATTATILKLYETGKTINKSPVVGYELEVNPSDNAPFTATTEQRIASFKIHGYETGKQVMVRYDPETKTVAINE